MIRDDEDYDEFLYGVCPECEHFKTCHTDDKIDGCMDGQTVAEYEQEYFDNLGSDQLCLN